jgi:hypothetical protein
MVRPLLQTKLLGKWERDNRIVAGGGVFPGRESTLFTPALSRQGHPALHVCEKPFIAKKRTPGRVRCQSENR